MNLIVGEVKLTFFQYPFPVIPEEKFGNVFRVPSLLSLAAMKAMRLAAGPSGRTMSIFIFC